MSGGVDLLHPQTDSKVIPLAPFRTNASLSVPPDPSATVRLKAKLSPAQNTARNEELDAIIG
jgi:hypothetical protein